MVGSTRKKLRRKRLGGESKRFEGDRSKRPTLGGTRRGALFFFPLSFNNAATGHRMHAPMYKAGPVSGRWDSPPTDTSWARTTASKRPRVSERHSLAKGCVGDPLEMSTREPRARGPVKSAVGNGDWWRIAGLGDHEGGGPRVSDDDLPLTMGWPCRCDTIFDSIDEDPTGRQRHAQVAGD